mmetsp:Transcript_53304/g.129506  ORF Transcript_53304/g.129506 Transcript_53304/m.129506 type:complete len:1054 (+) Transcript_53304:160-3321(+)
MILKGPKSMLSSAIADALNEYFVVDPHEIQSNLLKDTKIVLRHVQLRESSMVRPNLNTFGNQTCVKTTGVVEEVIFSWSWNTSTTKGKNWIKDAVLTIKGAQFYVDLSEKIQDEQQQQQQQQGNDEGGEEGETPFSSVDNDATHKTVEISLGTTTTDTKNVSAPAGRVAGGGAGGQEVTLRVLDRTDSADSQTKQDIKKQGGFAAYLTNQVRLVLDALTLSIEDFNLTVTMPSPDIAGVVEDEDDDGINTSTTTNGDGAGTNSDKYTISVVAGAKKFQIVSHGRQYKNEAEAEAEAAKDNEEQEQEPLSETVTLEDFFVDVVETYHDEYHHHNEGQEQEQAGSDGGSTSPTSSPNSPSRKQHRKKRDREIENRYPLQDPFSYNIEVERTDGRRFSSFLTGLKLKGTSLLRQKSTVEQQQQQQQQQELSFYLDRPQLEAFGQLSGLILAPPTTTTTGDDEKAESTDHATEDGKTSNTISYNASNGGLDNDTPPPEGDGAEYSTLDLALSGASLHYMNTSTIQLQSLSVHYCLDGSQLFGSIGSFTYRDESMPGGQRGAEVVILDVVANSRPSVNVTLGCIATLYIPETIELIQEMKMVRLSLSGRTWSMEGDEAHLSFPKVDEEYMQLAIDEAAEEQHQHHEQVDVGQLSLDEPDEPRGVRHHSQTTLNQQASSDVSETVSKFLVAPFPAVVQFKLVSLMKGQEEKTKIELQKSSLWVNPKDDWSGTEVAASVGVLQSDLATGADMTAFACIPGDLDANRYENFEFNAGLISVTAGYSVQDWLKTFSFSGLWSPTVREHKDKPVYSQLPNATIAPLKIQVQYNALSVVSVKSTTINVPMFKGKSTTLSKDITSYYTGKILKKTPNFLINADVLGLNVKDAGLFAFGATLAAANPYAGVAAMVGADAVKASVNAGKRGRRKGDDARGTVGDFFMGIGYAAVEATQSGAIRRGKSSHQQQDAFDWLVGVSAGTGTYVAENKEKFGQAGGATAGMITGGAIAGPVGMVVGGIIGGATSGLAIRRITNKLKAQEEKDELRQKEAERHVVKKAQLTLDG